VKPHRSAWQLWIRARQAARQSTAQRHLARALEIRPGRLALWWRQADADDEASSALASAILRTRMPTRRARSSRQLRLL